MTEEREKIDFDILLVGGGPAGLAAAIRLMQLAKEKGMELEVALIEKGAEIGSHAVSGAVLNPVALKELIPDYSEKNCPLETTVRGDQFCFRRFRYVAVVGCLTARPFCGAAVCMLTSMHGV